MTTIADLAQSLQTLLTQEASAAAYQTGFVQRTSKFDGPAFVQTLVFGWLANPDATLEDLAQMAGLVGVTITPQGLDDRFTEAGAACLKRVLSQAVGQLVSGADVGLPLAQRFSAIEVLDSTTIALPKALAATWPGGGDQPDHDAPAALKVSTRWDLRHGTLSGLDLQPGRQHDRTSALAHTCPAPGSLCLEDLGYWDLAEMAERSQQGVFWLMRWKVGTALFDASGQPYDLEARLAAHDGPELDLAVQIGAEQRLVGRLLAVRVPQEVADQRRQRLHQQARRKGQTVSARRLALADWTLLVTNLPTADLSLAEALVLTRWRWQIELLFKLWKSEGQLDTSRSSQPWRILCEVYAKLLALLVQHWWVILATWQYPDRSLVKAAHIVRYHVGALALSFTNRAQLEAVLAILPRCLSHGCRINKRRQSPAAFQCVTAASEAT